MLTVIFKKLDRLGRRGEEARKGFVFKREAEPEASGTRPIVEVYQARTEVNGVAANEPRRLPCGGGKMGLIRETWIWSAEEPLISRPGQNCIEKRY